MVPPMYRVTAASGRGACRAASGWLVLCGLVLASVPMGTADAQPRGLVRARYVQTRLEKDTGTAPVLIEEGVFYLDADGRYRVERSRPDLRTAEIVDVRARRRIVVDLLRDITVSGPASQVLPGTMSLPGNRVVVRPPLGFSVRAQRGDPQGTRLLCGWLPVTGTRSVFRIARAGEALTHTLELWYYSFAEPTLTPVVLEERFEDSKAVVARQIVDAAIVPVDTRLFAVPSATGAATTPIK